ncbi:MAG: type II toxin-antitoxin system RelE/ParE family toxin [Chlorobi bacterium]|nr:type II toxin-antitoxin system RelE/ParE family toxin [Chlorobiota bacterium]
MEKNAKIIWTEPAKNDLKYIFDFISGFSYKIADKTIDKIIEKTEILLVEGFEFSGQVDDLNPNYRRLIEGNNKIIYKVKFDEIIIHGVFDTREHPDKIGER